MKRQPQNHIDSELTAAILEQLGDDLDSGRNLLVAGELLRGQQAEVDVDAAWKAFAESHQATASNDDATDRLHSIGLGEEPATTIQDISTATPRWRTLTRYMLAAAAVAAIVVALALPHPTDSDSKQQLAQADKTEQLIYVADTKPAPVTLTADNGKPVTIPADNSEHLDALDMATESKTMTMTVPKGKTFRIDLADGTKVYMNADSRLTFPTAFTGQQRTVELEGEAYFSVAPDAEHPFVVRTQDMETTVLGTEFFVKADKAQPRQVTLVSGRVSVASGSHHATLSPGQQATLSEGRLTTKSGIDIERYRYWRDGLLYFDNVALEEVLLEIGRTYNCNIELHDATLRDLKIHFVADRTQPIATIVQTLNQMERISVKMEGDKLIVAN